MAKKSAIVQLSGRIGLNVYSNTEGKATGSLTFHINSLKILAFAKRREQIENNGASHSAKQGQHPEMADNINYNIQTEKHSFFSVKEKAWHNLGQIIQDYPTSAEAIKHAGLDYKVEKRKLFTPSSEEISVEGETICNKIEVPNYFVTSAQTTMLYWVSWVKTSKSYKTGMLFLFLTASYPNYLCQYP